MLKAVIQQGRCITCFRELAGGASQSETLLNSPPSRIRETRVMDSDSPSWRAEWRVGDGQRSFNTEPGWYHEARQAFVPEHKTGM